MILHFALTSDELIYPYYLSIMSALKTQNVDMVMLWCYKEPTGRYYPLVKERIVLKIVAKPDIPALRDKDPHFQCAHLKDLLEWRSLYEYGGMFFDLDTFSIRNATVLLDGSCEVVAALETYDVDDAPGSLHIGVVMAERGSKLIKEVWDNALDAARKPDMQWNATAGHYSAVLKANRDRVKFTDWGVLGGHGDRVVNLYSKDGYVWDKARVLHLYAKGMSHEFGRIDESYIESSDSIFARHVKQLLDRDEWGPYLDSSAMNVHFVNTGPDFPYTYYIGVMTALKVYGDKVILWTVGEPDSKYFDALRGKVSIRLIDETEIPEFNALKDKDDHFKRVAVFDYLMWRIIYEHGGMIMGLDSVTLKPHFDLLDEGKELLAPIDENHVLHFAMHGAIVRKGSAIAKAVINDAVSCLNGRAIKWGESGIVQFICHAKLNVDKISMAPYGLIAKGTTGLFSDTGQLLSDHVRTLALYSSSGLPVTIDESYIRKSGSLYARLVRQKLREEEWTVPCNSPVFGHAETDTKRFHMPGVPHLPTNKLEGLACAYSQKVIRMGKMLKSLGHTVFFYGVEGSDVECDEFVQVSTKEVLRQTYGDYDWKQHTFRHAYGDRAYNEFTSNAIKEIKRRKRPTDYLLIPWPGDRGVYDAVATRNVKNAKKLFLSVEMGIGYSGTFAQFRVFESYAWLHHVMGIEAGAAGKGDCNGEAYDVVIPNYFEPQDFEYCDQKDDYFLYLGRVIFRKGVLIAKDVCEAIGAKLLVAGQDGGEAVNGVQILDILKASPNVEFVGFADMEKRKQLLKKAKALFVPTIYIGPFEGVSIEAGLSGTPVITTDFGAFSENVIHGVTGYRCRTMDHFVWAANNIGTIAPRNCYDFAVRNYSIERVKLMYEEYFNMLMDLKKGTGWYGIHKDRTEMDWLKRDYV